MVCVVQNSHEGMLHKWWAAVNGSEEGSVCVCVCVCVCVHARVFVCAFVFLPAGVDTIRGPPHPLVPPGDVPVVLQKGA